MTSLKDWIPSVATLQKCGYIHTMTSIGIRDLKNNLSRVILRVADGESIDVTDHGRVVARLTPPPSREDEPDGLERLVALGAVRPAIEQAKPFVSWPVLGRPRSRRGLAKALIDEDRGG